MHLFLHRRCDGSILEYLLYLFERCFKSLHRTTYPPSGTGGLFDGVKERGHIFLSNFSMLLHEVHWIPDTVIDRTLDGQDALLRIAVKRRHTVLLRI